jgi:transcriptional regulator with XRE-family HTH domain
MNNDIYEYTIDVMRKKRREKCISLQTIADCLNVSKTFVANIENPKNRAKLNFAHVNELSKLFECNPKDFLPEQPL